MQGKFLRSHYFNINYKSYILGQRFLEMSLFVLGLIGTIFIIKTINLKFTNNCRKNYWIWIMEYLWMCGALVMGVSYFWGRSDSSPVRPPWRHCSPPSLTHALSRISALSHSRSHSQHSSSSYTPDVSQCIQSRSLMLSL